MAMPTYSNSRLYWWTALSVHQHHLCRLHASQTYSKIIKHQDLIISSPVTSSINFWDCKANLHTYSYNKHLQWWQKRVLRDLYVPHVHFCLLECMWNGDAQKNRGYYAAAALWMNVNDNVCMRIVINCQGEIWLWNIASPSVLSAAAFAKHACN